jgi:phosphotriesterase-related protein
MIITVTGPIKGIPSGIVLPHEHVLVDFSGAERIGEHTYDADVAFNTIMPHLQRAKALGLWLMTECTPSYLGRDPLLLRKLSKASGIQIMTNTGYYGARDGVFLPAHAYRDNAEQLAARWIDEWRNGIDGTGIKPGFIKIGINTRRPLSEQDAKLVRAAAITHRKTGLTIASHTKDGPVFEELEILRGEGVDPSAFIWVHAHDETDTRRHIAAAEMGSWVEFDAISDSLPLHLELLVNMKEQGLLHRVLLSHDTGWFEPGNEKRKYRGYEDLFVQLIPRLRELSFTQEEIDTLVVQNPIYALSVRKREIGKEMEEIV